jgi:hypothetical protein
LLSASVGQVAQVFPSAVGDLEVHTALVGLARRIVVVHIVVAVVHIVRAEAVVTFHTVEADLILGPGHL